MGRINIKDSGSYSSGGENSWFTLADDGEKAEIAFLYDDPAGEDVDYYLCHRVEIDGYERWINCIAVDDNGEDHKEDCPLCTEGYPRFEKLFLQLYNYNEEKTQVWERGKNFVNKISAFIERYGSLVNQPLEVIRSGRRGDTNTTYEMLPTEPDDRASVEAFGGRNELLGSLILDLNERELYQVIDGVYHMPNAQNNSNDSGSSRARRGRGSSEAPERRQRSTPAPERGQSRSRYSEESSAEPRSTARSERTSARTRETPTRETRTARRTPRR